MEAEILPRSCIILQVKCTFVSSDRNETDFVPSLQLLLHDMNIMEIPAMDAEIQP